MSESELSESLRKVNLLTSIKNPQPPFTKHVYIGHCFQDAPFISGLDDSLQQILESDYEITCYPRHQMGDRDRTIQERIDEGVSECQKCLLVMTKDYFADDFSNYEIQTIHKKGNRFSKDMIICLWFDAELQESKKSEFQEYCHLLITSENLRKPVHLFPLVEAIARPLSSQLTCLPKENIGYGAAVGYFYGYLRLVLPEFRKRFGEAIDTNPAALPNMKDRSVRKMFIILPKSCFCPIALESAAIENVKGFFVLRNASRAGNVARDYKSSVFRLTDQDSKVPVNEKEYYFAGELATPLLTMYESYHFGLLGMTKEQLYEERNAFCYTLYHVFQNSENRECNDEYRLIMWDDTQDANSEYKIKLHDLLLPILKEELKIEKSPPSSNTGSLELVSAGDSSTASTDSGNSVAGSEKDMAFKIENSNVQNLLVVYERMQFLSYPMREKGFRGFALVINIMNFDKPRDQFSRQLEKRKGATFDGEKMTALFQDLGFKVDLHTDVNNARLESLLMTYNKKDYSRSFCDDNSKDYSDCDDNSKKHRDCDAQAFICCIMTHGNLGQIYTSDCKPYKILSVVDAFSPEKCPSLKGKPKLFFVQSCQRGYDTSGTVTVGGLERDKKLTSDTAPDYNPEQDSPGKPECNVAHSMNSAPQSQQVSSEREITVDPTTNERSGTPSNNNSPLSSRASSYEMLDTELRATLVPGHPDILMSYSALPGSLSYRDKDMGSLYIDALATNLRKHHEIDRALKNVTKDVVQKLKTYGNESDGYPLTQLPFHLTTGMSKLLHLTPVKK